MSQKTIEISKESMGKISDALRQFSECDPGFAHTTKDIVATAHEAELRLVYADIPEADSVGAVAVAARACPSGFEGKWGYGTEIQMIRGEKSWEISKIDLRRIRAGSKEKLDISVNDTTHAKERKSTLRRLGIGIRQPA